MAVVTTRTGKGAALTFDEVDANFSSINNELEAVPAAIASAAGARNLLVNGNPIINQRAYVSGTATSSANQYTLDRWRVVAAGQSISWADSGGIRTVTAPAGGVEQVVEGAGLVTGSYTLSWSGTATATINGSPISNGGSMALPGGVNAIVRFSGGTLSKAQLEPGTVVTRFEQRPYGQELALCQRYYQRGILYGGGYGPTGASIRVANCTFTCQMRTLPSLLFLSGGHANCYFGGIDSIATTGFGYYIVVADTGIYAADFVFSANAEI